jgi:hypothetical protein
MDVGKTIITNGIKQNIVFMRFWQWWIRYAYIILHISIAWGVIYVNSFLGGGGLFVPVRYTCFIRIAMR